MPQLPVDLDQFLIVFNITRSYGYHNAALISTEKYGISYLPKEFFNMTQMNYISADLINRCGIQDIYFSKTKVVNHESCRWNNFINLNKVTYLTRYEINGNDNILKEFMSI